MSDETQALHARIAQLEARVAELERAAIPPCAGDPSEPEFIRRIRAMTPPPSKAAEEFFDRVTQGRQPIGAEALRQMQIDEGADPDSTWCREEIQRMREE